MIWHFLKVLQECLLCAAQNAEILQNLKKTKIILVNVPRSLCIHRV